MNEIKPLFQRIRAMALYTYYLFDIEASLIGEETLDHDDILDALERMRTVLDVPSAPYVVQLWKGDSFIGHIRRDEGRIVLRRPDPLPVQQSRAS